VRLLTFFIFCLTSLHVFCIVPVDFTLPRLYFCLPCLQRPASTCFFGYLTGFIPWPFFQFWANLIAEFIVACRDARNILCLRIWWWSEHVRLSWRLKREGELTLRGSSQTYWNFKFGEWNWVWVYHYAVEMPNFFHIFLSFAATTVYARKNSFRISALRRSIYGRYTRSTVNFQKRRTKA